MSEPIRIIIADDHEMLLEGLEMVFEKSENHKVVATASNGQEVLDQLEKHDADLVITDLSMPVMNGVELVKALKKSKPDIKALALTMHDQGHIISDALKAGVDGYILKGSNKEELLKAVGEIMAGNKYYSPLVQEALVKSLTQEEGSKKGELVVELTERELEVLELISKDFTQEQIAEKLFISSNTVIYHKRKLMAKFEVTTAAGLVRAAMSKGLLS